jgi:hypothetical protein
MTVPTPPPPIPDQLGVNTTQVKQAFALLETLSPRAWRSIEVAYEGSPTRDEAEEALSRVLTSESLREAWFGLRKAVAARSGGAAAGYAAESGEGVRTLEHPLAVEAWDGEHEATVVETLEPAHEDGFTNAACEMLGVLILRPYVSDTDFARFWQPYAKVVKLPG